MAPPPELLDWDLAVATARRLARPGPSLTLTEATDVVADLRRLAAQAEGHVAAYTGLTPAPGARTAVAVVDRGEWARSNVAGLRTLLEPVLTQLAARHARNSPLSTAVARRVTGVQLGTGLAWLSTKVLGQYEIFLPAAQGDGRLTLVAPNIVEVERALGVAGRDFRLWVCLHEQTHRLQFTAVPWLRGHLESLVGQLLDAAELEPAALLERLRRVLAEGVRSRGKVSLLDLVAGPRQRGALDALQAVMTLLEGHADQVMDAVGPDVVPSVELIRERFEQRRGGAGPLDRVVRRLLGLDAKLEQYRTGGRFTREVVARIGVAGFNEVWSSPQALPDLAELREPERWLARMRGASPAPA